MKKAPAPKLSTWSTIDECIAWLQAETGVAWSLPAILERGAMPSVWFDWAPEIRELLGDRTEGFNAPFVFSGDTNRMAVDRTAKLTMTRLPDGRLVRFTPGRDVAIADLRFAREDIERLSAQSTPAHQRDPATDNWKARVQIQAAELCKRQRTQGAQPSKRSLSQDLARWCRDKGLQTGGGVNPSAEYIRQHVLRDWSCP